MKREKKRKKTPVLFVLSDFLLVSLNALTLILLEWAQVFPVLYDAKQAAFEKSKRALLGRRESYKIKTNKQTKPNHNTKKTFSNLSYFHFEKAIR